MPSTIYLEKAYNTAITIKVVLVTPNMDSTSYYKIKSSDAAITSSYVAKNTAAQYFTYYSLTPNTQYNFQLLYYDGGYHTSEWNYSTLSGSGQSAGNGSVTVATNGYNGSSMTVNAQIGYLGSNAPYLYALKAGTSRIALAATTAVQPITVTGLTPGTMYVFNVLASNNNGASWLSLIMSDVGYYATPMPAGTTVSAITQAVKGFTCKVKLTTIGVGYIFQYRLACTSTTGTTAYAAFTPVANTDVLVTATGLTPGAVYSFTPQYCFNYNTTCTTWTALTTASTVTIPSTPVGGTVTPVSKNMTAMRVTVPFTSGSNSPALYSYVVLFGTTVTTMLNTVPLTGATSEEVDVHYLLPSTPYWFVPAYAPKGTTTFTQTGTPVSISTADLPSLTIAFTKSFANIDASVTAPTTQFS
ncbi:hypothetical protein JKP88DRAFT_289575 [Tribonema minus]|uniref:Fibronectin type-III domain-containing protein n=1 Tax=Tribonema minus TaxID=303371 RepID=A0A836CGJ4_9STRA|nr:hypothetical protein JKP88DRAFT_289575 [Tribonema minus]